MGFGSYNLVTNALNIFKQAIDITSQNITNASNSNYAQEVPIIQDTYPTGVNLQDVQRIQNLYFFQLLQNKSASLDYFNTRLQYNKQVQNIFNVVGQTHPPHLTTTLFLVLLHSFLQTLLT